MRTLSLLLVCLFISACGGSAPGAPPPPANSAPVFTSAAAVSVAEGASGTVYAARASDADGDAVSFALSPADGADSGLFAIDSSGAISFLSAPDFENPADANRDNIYEIGVRASDGRGGAASLALRLTVTDVSDAFQLRRKFSGLSAPIFLDGRSDGSGRVFIVERAGRILIGDPATGATASAPFLDLTGGVSLAGEGGLLGFALAPDFSSSGVFYVHLTNLAGNTEIRRYRRSAADPDIADPASADLILTVDQPASNHNGGWIGFSPSDNNLYIALGDGGGGNDQFGNGQNVNTLLGAMLRIDPSRDDFPTDPARDYGINPNNPFAGGGGRGEIFAWGLRNPFRASFDRATGLLYAGDVGQNAIEEIDRIDPRAPGVNLGWPALEGTRVNQTGSTAGMIAPVAEYGHGTGPAQGNSVTGGYVYRGPVEALQGEYVFGDFVRGAMWSIPVSRFSAAATVPSSQFTIRTSDLSPDVGAVNNIASFGEDDAGNLYVVDIDGEIFRLERR